MSTAPEELKRLRAVQRTLTDTRRSYRRQLTEQQDELERKAAENKQMLNCYNVMKLDEIPGYPTWDRVLWFTLQPHFQQHLEDFVAAKIAGKRTVGVHVRAGPRLSRLALRYAKSAAPKRS